MKPLYKILAGVAAAIGVAILMGAGTVSYTTVLDNLTVRTNIVFSNDSLSNIASSNPANMRAAIGALASTNPVVTGRLSWAGTTNDILGAPTLTTAQKLGLGSTVAGDYVYDSTLGRVQVYDGSAWHSRVRLDGDTNSTGVFEFGTLNLDTKLTITNSSTSTVPLTINAPSGQTADLLDLKVNGVPKVSVTSAGVISSVAIIQAASGSVGAALHYSGLANPKGLLVTSSSAVAWTPSDVTAVADTILLRDAANTLALRNGANAQQFNENDFWTDASNMRRMKLGWQQNANALTIATETLGTGIGTGGSIIFAPLGVTALTIATNGQTTVNFLTTTLDLTVGRQIIAPKTITASGTTGTQTINKISGRVNFAGAATSLVVTNSLCTANSVIIATMGTADATAARLSAVPADGQFTLTFGVAPTAETAVYFLLTN